MFYNIRNFAFIYIMVVIFSTCTFAPWTNQPERPPNDMYGTCNFWLNYHGFTDNNFENKRLASLRVTEYDQNVSYFAAVYAYLLGNKSELYEIKDFGPSAFCGSHTINYVTYPFMTLKDVEFTCEGWIDLYIYVENRKFYVFYDQNNFPYNTIWAIHRDMSMDNNISLWAALYFKYLFKNYSNEIITPREFCRLMGKPVMNVPLPKKFSFMTLNESRMSCREWQDIRNLPILKENVLAEEKSTTVTKLPFTNIGTVCYEKTTTSGFSDNKSTNYQMLLSESVDINSVNYFVKEYIKYGEDYVITHKEYKKHLQFQLQEELLRLNFTSSQQQHQYNYINYLRHKIENFDDVVETLMSPKEFCKSWDFPVKDLLNYYGAMNSVNIS